MTTFSVFNLYRNQFFSFQTLFWLSNPRKWSSWLGNYVPFQMVTRIFLPFFIQKLLIVLYQNTIGKFSKKSKQVEWQYSTRIHSTLFCSLQIIYLKFRFSYVQLKISKEMSFEIVFMLGIVSHMQYKLFQMRIKAMLLTPVALLVKLYILFILHTKELLYS